MNLLNSDGMQITNARFFPIIREYSKRLGIVKTINSMVDCQMDLQPGEAINAMVIDCLSGRTPLFRFTESMIDQDNELIFGHQLSPELFNDTNLGRAMDKVYAAGAHKIFTQVSHNAIDGFELDTRAHHFDTTSVSVYGDYDYEAPPLNITYGHSKAKRPDLKQFMISMCCVDRNIPIIGKTQDGNASDKTLNNELLSTVSSYMAKNGLNAGASIHVADSAFVTGDNLKKSREKHLDFLSRMPSTFKECKRIIQDAVETDQWEEIGRLSLEEGSSKRTPAHYRAYDSTVTVEEHVYRAIVFHSSSYDKRRQKSIEKKVKADRLKLEKSIKLMTQPAYQCKPDAQAASNSLRKMADNSFHTISIDVTEELRYGRGRPKQGEIRVPKYAEYVLNINLEENPEKTKDLRLKAGCFVLITSLKAHSDMESWTAADLLSLYKEQDGIEKNFGFLKDPAIINAVFLKKPSRIEVLGLVLLLALLIWRLIERNLRLHVKESGKPLPGWVKRTTTRPTTFMMSTKFLKIYVITAGRDRKLASPLSTVQLAYLEALKLGPDIFISV